MKVFPLLFFFLALSVGCGLNEGNRSGAEPDDSVPVDDGNHPSFVSKWRIDGDGTKIVLPLPTGLEYDFEVDWGDGEVTSHTDAEAMHVYKNAGIYTVSITGLVEGWSFAQFPRNRDNIVSVEDLGALGWRRLRGAFAGCESLTSVAGGDTSDVVTMRSMFEGASSVTPDVSGWDTSAVTDMAGMFVYAGVADPNVSGWNTAAVMSMRDMFRSATAANPDVSNWNTAQVTDMRRMFMDALVANPSVSNWNTAYVMDMSHMFRGAVSADPDVSNWDVSSVTTMNLMFAEAISANPAVGKWNTESVTSMKGMFSRATSADPVVNNWNTAAVTNMAGMFLDAISANPKLDCWDVTRVIDMRYMFSGSVSADPDLSKWNFARVAFMHEMFSEVTLSSDHYSKLLVRLAETSPRTNLILDAGDSMYDASGVDARQTLLERGWHIIDGGAEADEEKGSSVKNDSE